MDWFSWLSRSSLEPSLIYEYGHAFARNELQKEDLTYFNHEFLHSMGITVAKHRLEILKLANKEVGGSPKSLSRLVLAINKTKKSISKCINKWVFQEVETIKTMPEPWKYKSGKELIKVEKPLPVVNPRRRRVTKSGPLDGRLTREKVMITNKSLKLSGPLDRNMQERLVLTYKSPISSGPLDGRMYSKLSGPLDRRPPSPRVYTDYNKKEMSGQTLWAALFQDLKPT